MLGIPNVVGPSEEIARGLANGITAPSRLSGAAIPTCPRVGEPALSCGCDVFRRHFARLHSASASPLHAARSFVICMRVHRAHWHPRTPLRGDLSSPSPGDFVRLRELRTCDRTELRRRLCNRSAAHLLLMLASSRAVVSDLPLHLHRLPEPLRVRVVPDASKGSVSIRRSLATSRRSRSSSRSSTRAVRSTTRSRACSSSTTRATSSRSSSSTIARPTTATSGPARPPRIVERPRASATASTWASAGHHPRRPRRATPRSSCRSTPTSSSTRPRSRSWSRASRRREIAAVGGRVDVRNKHDNWLTRHADDQVLLRPGAPEEPRAGAPPVMCLSGCLTAYRRTVLIELEPILEDRNILGVPIKYGEDRFLTRQIVKAGYQHADDARRAAARRPRPRCAATSPSSCAGAARTSSTSCSGSAMCGASTRCSRCTTCRCCCCSWSIRS